LSEDSIEFTIEEHCHINLLYVINMTLYKDYYDFLDILHNPIITDIL